jgi:hypothetical protein
MKILVPSYHKEGRKISKEIFDREETYFFIRPCQENWYKNEFPKANKVLAIPDDTPVGIIGVAVARQCILDFWRNNYCAEEWAFIIDDDISDFYTNDKPIKDGGKKYKITVDEAFEILKSYSDENTTIIGATNCDLNLVHNPNKIKINYGEAPEGCSIISKKVMSNYITDVGTFENQLIAGLEISRGKQFKTINKVLFKRYSGKDNSVIFPASVKEDIYNITKNLCLETMKYLKPNLVKLYTTMQGTCRLDFIKKETKGFNI